MEFFLDTANVEEIREIAALGILDGVTTNPSLVAQSGRDFHEVVHEICEIVDGPVSAEVISTNAEMMIEEGRTLAGIHKHVVVKCPCTPDGLKACTFLSDQEIPVNVTLVFSPVQALLAAKAGAAYVSPFIGRLDDISQIGIQIIEDIRTIFDNYDFDTAILAASIRHPAHVLEAALAGADVATIPYKVMKQLFKHPLTDSGLSKFLKDWNQQKV
ncbi:MAG: fructose-6-phosphate aldolase [Deltaproteobacteria bacterium RIFCSPHIGHO2_12_FULL_43_9]|nr:MAG: fructose-6-phosphate aldolase [Deltaproteobacteria bacterium RIFCSPHIGHO2_12_FULL_43_9]